MRESPCLLICSIKDEEAQGTWRYRAQYIGQILKERESEKKRNEGRRSKEPCLENTGDSWKKLSPYGEVILLLSL